MSRTYSKYLLPIFRMYLRAKIQITNIVADFLSADSTLSTYSRVEWLLTIRVSHQIILTLTILNNCHLTSVFLAG